MLNYLPAVLQIRNFLGDLDLFRILFRFLNESSSNLFKLLENCLCIILIFSFKVEIYHFQHLKSNCFHFYLYEARSISDPDPAKVTDLSCNGQQLKFPELGLLNWFRFR